MANRFCVLTGNFETAPSYPKNHANVKAILERKDLFSYAFTYINGRLAEKGFSYTTWPPNGIPSMD
jgi:hypothetical protein